MEPDTKKIKEFQNTKNVFPSKDKGETRLEFDGPRSDQTITDYTTEGFRGKNRFVVYIKNFEPNANRDKIIITRVFLSNDHYGNKHEIKIGSNALKLLGGLGKFSEAHRAYFNHYDVEKFEDDKDYDDDNDDDYEDDDDDLRQQRQVHMYAHYDNLSSTLMTSMLMVVVIVLVVHHYYHVLLYMAVVH